MPSKKIFIVLIICLAIIASIFIYQKSTKTTLKNVDNGSIDVSNQREEIKIGYDWQKILTNTSEVSTTYLNNTGDADDTTMTSDVAKTFFAQYLLLKKDGKDLTQADALSIAKNTISSPEYNKIMGAQYTVKNIHVNEAVNPTTVSNYYNALGKVSKIWLTHKITEEFTITNKAITTKNETELKKLDPIISDYKKIISMLLEMQVPSDATQIHLELLNSTSNILFSVEAMRVSFSDPVKGVLGLDRYEGYMLSFAKSVKKIDLYFTAKGLKIR